MFWLCSKTRIFPEKKQVRNAIFLTIFGNFLKQRIFFHFWNRIILELRFYHCFPRFQFHFQTSPFHQIAYFRAWLCWIIYCNTAASGWLPMQRTIFIRWGEQSRKEGKAPFKSLLFVKFLKNLSWQYILFWIFATNEIHSTFHMIIIFLILSMMSLDLNFIWKKSFF